MMAPVPGLLYVSARFTNPELEFEAYDKWYNEEHIPHLLTMSGCHAAMRYTDVNAEEQEPYLALYPLHDVFWVHSEEFGAAIASTESDRLPGRSVFLSVAFDGRSYTLLDSHEKPQSRPGAGKFVILTTFSPRPGSDAGQGASFLDGNLPALDFLNGFRRADRYFLHEDQPADWKVQWEENGGWPIRDMLVMEFDESQDRESLVSIAADLDRKEAERGRVTAHSRVYELTAAFEVQKLPVSGATARL